MSLLLKIGQVVWRICEFLCGKVFSWTVLMCLTMFFSRICIETIILNTPAVKVMSYST